MNDSSKLATRPGPEDLAVVRLGGKDVLFTATASRRLIAMKRQPPAIESHVIGSGDPSFRVAWEGGSGAGDALANDSPLGIVARPVDGKILLYAVGTDHPRFAGKGRVCVFEATSPGQVRPVWQTPWDAGLKHANGIAVTAQGDIFVSTFGLLPKRAKPAAGPAAGASGSNAIYRYRPGQESWHLMATGITGANGLAFTERDTHLLIGSYHDRSILAFPLDPSSGALRGEPVPVRTGLTFHPDNLKALGGNRFSAAGQRCFAAVIPHSLFGLRTAKGGGEIFEWHPGRPARRLLDLDPFLSRDRCAPSVALPVHRRLYVGHIVSPGVGIFDLPAF